MPERIADSFEDLAESTEQQANEKNEFARFEAKYQEVRRKIDALGPVNAQAPGRIRRSATAAGIP